MSDNSITIGQIFQVVAEFLTFLIIPTMIKMIVDVAELKTDMRWLKLGIKVTGDKAGRVLHSPHTPEFDDLIEKFWHGQLAREDAQQLCQRLSEIVHEEEKSPIRGGPPYTQVQKSVAGQMLLAVSFLCRVSPPPEAQPGGAA